MLGSSGCPQTNRSSGCPGSNGCSWGNGCPQKGGSSSENHDMSTSEQNLMRHISVPTRPPAAPLRQERRRCRRRRECLMRWPRPAPQAAPPCWPAGGAGVRSKQRVTSRVHTARAASIVQRHPRAHCKAKACNAHADAHTALHTLCVSVQASVKQDDVIPLWTVIQQMPRSFSFRSLYIALDCIAIASKRATVGSQTQGSGYLGTRYPHSAGRQRAQAQVSGQAARPHAFSSSLLSTLAGSRARL